MNCPSDPCLQSHTEPLVAISIAHLHPTTRRRLAENGLSVLAYPNDYGGFVYVDSQSEHSSQEPELATLIDIARRAGIVWIKFDCDALTVDGIPVFDDEEESS